MSEDIAIDIVQLSKTYKGSEAHALKSIDLSVRRGEIFGVLGPNGAGKTTLLSILSGLVKPSSGSVRILGCRLPEELATTKKMMGVVPQHIALYPNLSGRDNLLFIGSMYGLHASMLRLRVDKLLDQFGFAHNARKLVKKYSGGMQRRINLIAALLHEPRILLLDEPTVGMDVQSRSLMMNYVKQVNETSMMTVIYTSHYLEQAAQFCDRIAIIDQGAILRMNTPEGLLRDEDCTHLEDVFLKLTGRSIRD